MPCPGYAVAAYVLVVVVLVTGVLAVLAVIHYRRRNLDQEKALHTRSTINLPSVLSLSLIFYLFLFLFLIFYVMHLKFVVTEDFTRSDMKQFV